jgi:hypothetical protein
MDINNYSYTPYMLDEPQKTDISPVYDVRAITLNIMYSGSISGIDNARLETKNFIYDSLSSIISNLIMKTK